MSHRTRLLALLLCSMACAPTAISTPSAVDASTSLDASDAATNTDLSAPTDLSPDDTATDAPATADTPATTDAPSGADVIPPADVPAVTDVAVADDRPAIACTSDTQCSAPFAICDRLRGMCAACSTSVSCPSGSSCSGGRCLPSVSCASSRTCPGQVCDTTAGRCVDCLVDPDCPSGERCRANLCVPTPRSCRSSRECSELNQVCNTMMGTCVDCASDVDCSEGICRADGTCAPRVCVPSSRSCASVSAVRVCDARGAASSDAPCGVNEVCQAGQCMTRVCAPGAMDCGGDGARRVCNADGLGYTSSACPAMQVCSGGMCLDGCPGGLLRCVGGCVDARADANNCGACGVRCGAGEICAAGREGCVAACVPATSSVTIRDTPLSARLPVSITANPTATSASGRGVTGEEVSTGIAFVIGRTGQQTNADLSEAAARIATAVTQSNTARSHLAGQRFTLADGTEAIEERIAVNCASATALRDRIGASLALVTAAAAPVVGVDTSCIVDYAVTRTSTGELRIALAVASRARYDMSDDTARRVRDLAVFGIPQSSTSTAAVCASLRAAAVAPVDLLWLQDTSGSLTQYQARVARASGAFLSRFVATGLDARVAVLRADANAQNVDSPGLSWVLPSQGNAAFALCDRLTSSSLGSCPLSGSDMTGPYPNNQTSSGSGEEPIAASISNTTNLLARGARGETNVDRRIRAGARVMTLGLTDESGSNDFSRYFQSTSSPDTMTPWGSTFGPSVIANIAGWFTRRSVLAFGFYPHRMTRCGAEVFDLPRCVTSASGGAWAELLTTTDADTASAMVGFVDAIAAELSTLRLPAVPVSGVAKVAVRGVDVPRSRVDGYDIDPVRRALVFYGSRYRPMTGDVVNVSFPAW